MNFGGAVINLPHDAVNYLKSATRDELAALIALLACPRGGEYESYADEAAGAAGITNAQLSAALSFWRGTGIIGFEAEPSREPEPTEAAAKAAPAKREAPVKKRGTPEMTGEEAEALIEASPERRSLLDECQQAIGHMFNSTEAAIVLSMREYLGVDDEYILLLVAYCARHGKRGVKYVETMAYSMVERGIETSVQLDEYLSWREASQTTEGKLRTLLGMERSSFSPKQREMFERWSRTFGYGFEMMEAAYNATVDAIGKPSMPYMNKVLESWHSLGYSTPDEVRSGGGGRKPDATGTFDTNDFFDLAVKRGLSLGDGAGEG